MTATRSDAVRVYDHLRPTGADARTVDGTPVDPGVYRMVRTGEETATLLRVGNADGRRVASGEVLTVPQSALEEFETVENPDGNRPASESVAAGVETLGWQAYAFGRSLAAHPGPTAAALAALAVGRFGDRLAPAPDWALTAATVVGALGLAYAGTRGW